MATLIITAGPNEGTHYPLGKRTTVIGRNETCALQVLDDRVSGKHCQIRYEDFDKSYKLLDMKSTNGTTSSFTLRPWRSARLTTYENSDCSPLVGRASWASS